MVIKVCVTGGSGFIGSALCKHLSSAGYSTFKWKRSQPDDLGEAKVMVHLASRVHDMKNTETDFTDEYLKDNLDLTISLYKNAIQKNFKKFIFVSTVKVVGEAKGSYNLDSPCFPFGGYAISKLKAENELESLSKDAPTMETVVIRLPMVYGPGNKGNMLTLLKAAEKKIPLPIGSAGGKRSMIGVENVADAFMTVIKKEVKPQSNFRRYFIKDDSDFTSAELYSMIFGSMHSSSGVFPFPEKLIRLGGSLGSQLESRFNRHIPINSGIVSRLFDEYRFSAQVFAREYDWAPPLPTQEGIRKTVSWYLSTL